MNIKILPVVLITLSSAAHSENLGFSNEINESAWHPKLSVFECRIEQHIPYYGKAIFRTRAGEASRFCLVSKAARMKSGQADILSVSPAWSPVDKALLLGQAKVRKSTRPIVLRSQKTELMLAELYKGHEIEFHHNTWYDDVQDNGIQVNINTIGFRTSYSQYLDCLKGLLPANFNQLKRTTLTFNPGGDTDGLLSGHTRQLDKILKLIEHDKEIQRFFIDGHTSSEGDRTENLELSKVRAELVAKYLKDRGVPEDWITVRWHGERYPVANNDTSAGRAKNRRVTVRLEKVDDVEAMPMASQ